MPSFPIETQIITAAQNYLSAVLISISKHSNLLLLYIFANIKHLAEIKICARNCTANVEGKKSINFISNAAINCSLVEIADR